MESIYFLVSLFATTIGAFAGLGGGVIIKPVLDFIGDYNVSTIGLLSSFTVFVMALVSIIKQSKNKVKIETRKTVLIGIGSVFGGILGERVLVFLSHLYQNNQIKSLQNILLLLVLLFIFFYIINKKRIKTQNVNNFLLCILAGGFLGFMASFLGIGGGPINVCVLSFMFSMEPKEAAINSIVTIIFAQASQLITVIVTRGINEFYHPMLPIMLLGGILGGLLGSKLNEKVQSNTVLIVFNMLITCLIALTGYNILKSV